MESISCKHDQLIGTLTEGVNNLVEWQRKQNGNIKDINEDLKAIKKDIQEIKIALASPRGPSWAVATIMTILSSICVSLIVFVATRLGGG